MNKKRLLILAIIPTLLLIGSAVAAITLNFSLNMTMNVAPGGSATISIDGGDPVSNGDSVTLDWGTITVGDNTKDITITNNCNVPLTPSLTEVTGLPAGCELTLSLTNPIDPVGSASGFLHLKIPATVTPDTYGSMTAKIIVSYS